MIRCPKCGSTSLSAPFEKKARSRWSLGVPTLARYERGYELSYEVIRCLDCDHEFLKPSPLEEVEVPPQGILREGTELCIPIEEGRYFSTRVAAPLVTIKLPVGDPHREFLFEGQVMVTPAPEGLSRPTIVFTVEGQPVGIMWAASDRYGVVQPFISRIRP